MERDVTGLMHKGAEVGDLAAGLAYSVALNYLNRVVRGRKIGKVIFFQGGTAYNDAVAAAFSAVLGKQIIVPPHNGVIGAIGMALIARDRMKDSRQPSRFRGYDLGQRELHHARVCLPGVLQLLRHEGIQHRGPAHLLGRQVLGQVPQARQDRPQTRG